MKHTKKITPWVVALAMSAGVWASSALTHAGQLGALYLSPSRGTYQVGKQFTVAVRLDSGSGAVNVAEGEISFNPEKLQVVGLSQAGSVFTLWAQQPSFSNTEGVISFAGGVPTPGFFGTNGRILNITFRPRSSTGGSTTAVAFVSGSILANDGQGTNVIGSLAGAHFTIANPEPAPTPSPRPPEQTPVPAVTPITRPVITQYPAQVKSRTAFDVGGTADPDAIVWVMAFRSATPLWRVIFNTIPDAVVETRADAAGQWLLTIGHLNNGVYRLEAAARTTATGQSVTSEPVSVRVGYATLWWLWDALAGRTGWAILLWLILLIAILLAGRYVTRAFGHARATPPRRRTHGPTDKLMRMIQDIHDELALLDKISKDRPLYPEEKYLRSKLMQYRRELKSALSE